MGQVFGPKGTEILGKIEKKKKFLGFLIFFEINKERGMVGSAYILDDIRVIQVVCGVKIYQLWIQHHTDGYF